MLHVDTVLVGDETVVRGRWVLAHRDLSYQTPITTHPLVSNTHTYGIKEKSTEQFIHDRWLLVVCAHVCVNILSCVIKKQTNLVYLETPCRLHTHTHGKRHTEGSGNFPLYHKVTW